MQVTIPEIVLPFEIPSMIHPLIVHFVIVLPLVVLILELVNLFTKSRAVGVINFVFLLLTSFLLYAAYLSGSVDANGAIESAKEALATHKQIGIYLFYGSLIVLLFKLVSLALQKAQVKFLYLLALIVFNAAMLNDAKKGADLVYKYGVNVGAKSITEKEIKKTPLKVNEEIKQENTQKANKEQHPNQKSEENVKEQEQTTKKEQETSQAQEVNANSATNKEEKHQAKENVEVVKKVEENNTKEQKESAIKESNETTKEINQEKEEKIKDNENKKEIPLSEKNSTK